MGWKKIVDESVGILELVHVWDFEEVWAFERINCLINSTIFGGLGVIILEEVGCTKYTIYTISLVIKWAKFWNKWFVNCVL